LDITKTTACSIISKINLGYLLDIQEQTETYGNITNANCLRIHALT